MAKRFLNSFYYAHLRILNDGSLIRFHVLYTREAERLLAAHKGQVVSLEIISPGNLLLTKRQEEALILAAVNGTASPTLIARKLGISRQAASKLLSKALKKLVRRSL